MTINEVQAHLDDIFELEKQKLGLEFAIHTISGHHFKSKYIGLQEKYNCIGRCMRKTNEKGVWAFFTFIGFLAGFWFSRGDILGAILGVLAAWVACFAVIFATFLIINAVYNREIVSRNAEIEKENKMLYKQACEKNKLLQASANKLRKAYLKTEYTLDKIYSLNIIRPECHNMIAVSSIYEYLNSKKAASLETAYEMYETAVRLEKIITKMYIIISMPEKIADNQPYLYSAIKDIQPKSDDFSNSIIENSDKLDKTAVNTAVTEYITNVNTRIKQIADKIKIK